MLTWEYNEYDELIGYRDNNKYDNIFTIEDTHHKFLKNYFFRQNNFKRYFLSWKGVAHFDHWERGSTSILGWNNNLDELKQYAEKIAQVMIPEMLVDRSSIIDIVKTQELLTDTINKL